MLLMVLETSEAEAMSMYNKALSLLIRGESKGAEHEFNNLLNSRLVKEAEVLLDKTLEDDIGKLVHPGLPLKYSAHKNIASIAAQRSDYRQAIDAYLQAVIVDATDVTVWYKMGVAALKEHHYLLAKHAFLQGLQCSPTHWLCLDNAITVLYALNNYTSCLYYISRGLERDPGYLKALTLRQRIHKEQPSIRRYTDDFFAICDIQEFQEELDAEEGREFLDEALAMRNKQHELSCRQQPAKLKLNSPLKQYSWKELGERLLEIYNTAEMTGQPMGRTVDISTFVIEPRPVDADRSGKEADAVAKPVVESAPEETAEKNEESSAIDRVEVMDTDVAAVAVEGPVTDADTATKVEEPSVTEKPSEPVVESGETSVADVAVDQESSAPTDTPSVKPVVDSEFTTPSTPSIVNTPAGGDATQQPVLHSLSRAQMAALIAEETPTIPSASAVGGQRSDDQSTKPGRGRPKGGAKRKRYLLEDFDDGFAKRRSARVRNTQSVSAQSINYTEMIAKYLPASLLSIMDTVNDDADEEVQSLPAVNSVAQPHHNETLNAADSINDFSTHEEKRVKDFLEKHVVNSGIVSLLLEYLIALAKLRNMKWYGSLIASLYDAEDVSYERVREMSLLTCYMDIMADVWTEFAVRVNWLQARFLMLQGKVDAALNTFDQLTALLNHARETEPGREIVRLYNCKTEFVVNEDEVKKQLDSLRRSQSLDEVQKLYALEQYKDVVDLILPTFNEKLHKHNQASEENCNIPERHGQLLLLQDSLMKLGDFKQCLQWGEEAFNEALVFYTLSNDTSMKIEWVTTMTQLLDGLEKCISHDEVIEFLPANKTSRLMKNLLKVIEIALDIPESSTDMAVGSVHPWIILYRLILHEEKKSSVAVATSAEKPSLPSSFLFLNMAHDCLGRHSSCTNSDGALLLFFVDQIWEMVKGYTNENQHPHHEELELALEQCIYCLYNHPNKKGKARHLQDHNVNQITLSWESAVMLFYYFKPKTLPEFDSYKTSTVSADLENLLRRITLLIPNTDVPQITIDSISQFIDGVTQAPPTFPEEHQPDDRPVINEIYYLLADYYFKNKEQGKAIKFYLHDLCLNPERFDSWAGMALARSSRLEQKLNSNELKSEPASVSKVAASALRCFKRALEVDSTNSKLWIEYGSFSYSLRAYFSRQIKQNNLIPLTEESRSLATSKQSDMMELALKCYNKAYEIEGEAGDELWLLNYMLGKAAEKTKQSPKQFLTHYLAAAEYLHEEGARYPKKIHYMNVATPHYAVESLEIYFRIHTSIAKYLVRQVPTEEELVLFEKTVTECSTSPFALGNELKNCLAITDESSSSNIGPLTPPPGRKPTIHAAPQDHDYSRQKNVTSSESSAEDSADTSFHTVPPEKGEVEGQIEVVKGQVDGWKTTIDEDDRENSKVESNDGKVKESDLNPEQVSKPMANNEDVKPAAVTDIVSNAEKAVPKKETSNDGQLFGEKNEASQTTSLLDPVSEKPVEKQTTPASAEPMSEEKTDISLLNKEADDVQEVQEAMEVEIEENSVVKEEANNSSPEIDNLMSELVGLASAQGVTPPSVGKKPPVVPGDVDSDHSKKELIPPSKEFTSGQMPPVEIDTMHSICLFSSSQDADESMSQTSNDNMSFSDIKSHDVIPSTDLPPKGKETIILLSSDDGDNITDTKSTDIPSSEESEPQPFNVSTPSDLFSSTVDDVTTSTMEICYDNDAVKPSDDGRDENTKNREDVEQLTEGVGQISSLKPHDLPLCSSSPRPETSEVVEDTQNDIFEDQNTEKSDSVVIISDTLDSECNVSKTSGVEVTEVGENLSAKTDKEIPQEEDSHAKPEVSKCSASKDSMAETSGLSVVESDEKDTKIEGIEIVLETSDTKKRSVIESVSGENPSANQKPQEYSEKEIAENEACHETSTVKSDKVVANVEEVMCEHSNASVADRNTKHSPEPDSSEILEDSVLVIESITELESEEKHSVSLKNLEVESVNEKAGVNDLAVVGSDAVDGKVATGDASSLVVEEGISVAQNEKVMIKAPANDEGLHAEGEITIKTDALDSTEFKLEGEANKKEENLKILGAKDVDEHVPMDEENIQLTAVKTPCLTDSKDPSQNVQTVKMKIPVADETIPIPHTTVIENIVKDASSNLLEKEPSNEVIDTCAKMTTEAEDSVLQPSKNVEMIEEQSLKIISSLEVEVTEEHKSESIDSLSSKIDMKPISDEVASEVKFGMVDDELKLTEKLQQNIDADTEKTCEKSQDQLVIAENISTINKNTSNSNTGKEKDAGNREKLQEEADIDEMEIGSSVEFVDKETTAKSNEAGPSKQVVTEKEVAKMDSRRASDDIKETKVEKTEAGHNGAVSEDSKVEGIETGPVGAVLEEAKHEKMESGPVGSVLEEVKDEKMETGPVGSVVEEIKVEKMETDEEVVEKAKVEERGKSSIGEVVSGETKDETESVGERGAKDENKKSGSTEEWVGIEATKVDERETGSSAKVVEDQSKKGSSSDSMNSGNQNKMDCGLISVETARKTDSTPGEAGQGAHNTEIVSMDEGANKLVSQGTNSKSIHSKDDSSKKEQGLQENKESAKKEDFKTNTLKDSAVIVRKDPERPTVADPRVKAVLNKCAAALQLCLQRFPTHYKSQYRLAFIHAKSITNKNLQMSRDYLLGTPKWQEVPFMTAAGLFHERKHTNFFNGVWRIPIDDIDRCGTFATHLYKAVWLLLEVLLELEDSSMLLWIHQQLQKTPEGTKKYLRDAERIALSKLALDWCLSAHGTRVKQMKQTSGCNPQTSTSVMNSESLHKFLMETYKIWSIALKGKPGVVKVNSLLMNAFKLCKPHLVPTDGDVLEEAIRYCQQQASIKPQATTGDKGPKTSSSTDEDPSEKLSATPDTHNPSSSTSITKASKEQLPLLQQQQQQQPQITKTKPTVKTVAKEIPAASILSTSLPAKFPAQVVPKGGTKRPGSPLVKLTKNADGSEKQRKVAGNPIVFNALANKPQQQQQQLPNQSKVESSAAADRSNRMSEKSQKIVESIMNPLLMESATTTKKQRPMTTEEFIKLLSATQTSTDAEPPALVALRERGIVASKSRSAPNVIPQRKTISPQQLQQRRLQLQQQQQQQQQRQRLLSQKVQSGKMCVVKTAAGQRVVQVTPGQRSSNTPPAGAIISSGGKTVIARSSTGNVSTNLAKQQQAHRKSSPVGIISTSPRFPQQQTVNKQTAGVSVKNRSPVAYLPVSGMKAQLTAQGINVSNPSSIIRKSSPGAAAPKLKQITKSAIQFRQQQQQATTMRAATSTVRVRASVAAASSGARPIKVISQRSSSGVVRNKFNATTNPVHLVSSTGQQIFSVQPFMSPVSQRVSIANAAAASSKAATNVKTARTAPASSAVKVKHVPSSLPLVTISASAGARIEQRKHTPPLHTQLAETEVIEISSSSDSD
ncbi:uncharacterized protein LOC141912887 [Tubulanus polymorphus]|uniref:uncharacterized protein LOC141912887 n=1 Tax=Tubulanus polymorphus TaxID=672921 RepID=UPI003DA458E2